MNLFLLAAGEGTRFRPHTLIKPKPALPFLNVPMAFYSLGLCDKMDFSRFTVNTFHLPGQIVGLFDHYKFAPQFSHEKGTIQGSGGALKLAETLFDKSDDLIMLNGDEVILPHAPGMMESAVQHHKTSGALATLVVMNHPEVGSKFGGVWTTADHQVIDIGKTRPKPSAMGHHFIGIFIFSPRIFNFLPQGPSHIFTDVLLPAIRKGEKVEAYPVEVDWFETGNLNDYLVATRACLHLLTGSSWTAAYLKDLIAGHSPESKLIRNANGLLLTATNPNQKFKDFAVVGKGVQIKATTSLTESVVASQVIDSRDSDITKQLLL